MTTTVELATVPSADTPGTCVFVHHDKRSYVFGRVAEGTQRAFGSRKIHLGGTEHVFLSGPVGWAQMGGLVGYLLSVAAAVDSARDHVRNENDRRRAKGQKLLRQTDHCGVGIHAGDNLCHVLAACRPVILRQPVRVRLFEHRSDPRAADPAKTDADFEDDAIRVWKVPVGRARSASPPKRLYSALSADGLHKPPAALSEPDVAAMIVERVMFSGTLDNRSLLVPRKLRQLKPTDVAIVAKNGMLKAYKGPYATDGEQVPNPDDTAWVFPDQADDAADGRANDDTLPINHHPLPPTSYCETAMSYIVKCHGRRGKFNAPVAKELGVKPPDFKLLAMGQSVQGKDGTTVTPDMVLGEPQPGKGIIVADVPSLDFVDAFLERPEWRTGELMEHICVMYWILGPGVADDARVQAFIDKHPRLKHVLCSEDTCPNMITHPGAAEVQVKLRRIDPERFPLAKFDNTVKYRAPAAGSPVELGRAGTRLQLMPRFVYGVQDAAPFPDLVGAAQAVGPEVLALAATARAEASAAGLAARIDDDAAALPDADLPDADLPNPDAEVVPLGTGSSMPSKHRNVSATLVRVPGIGNYLLDCGEGTLGQMRRAFGDDGAAEVLRGLRCIVISHLHADHHLGAVSVIKAWYEQALRDGRGDRLAVSCIGRYRVMLEELAQAEDVGLHRLLFPSCPWPRAPDRDLTTRADLGADALGLASIRRVPVPHCWRSYATQLELESGLRIAYSGDCRPSPAFAQLCRGAHLLVHECTFGDDRADHARAKKHSTLGEALAVARAMDARRTLLTHFSQRYTKADCLRADAPPGVLLALDMMRVRLADFARAARFAPAVQALLERLGD